MGEDVEPSAEIKETDIVFDCPHCGKSLVIDYRGAGLTIPCTDCGNKVEVPIPEGMEIADIDSTAEEQEAEILHLRRAAASADERLAELQGELDEMSSRRDALERGRSGALDRDRQVRDKLAVIKQALEVIANAVSEVEHSIAGNGE